MLATLRFCCSGEELHYMFLETFSKLNYSDLEAVFSSHYFSVMVVGVNFMFFFIVFELRWGEKSVWIMNVKGTAFLWHQVRCMAAVLFMVGAGHESPTVRSSKAQTLNPKP